VQFGENSTRDPTRLMYLAERTMINIGNCSNYWGGREARETLLGPTMEIGYYI